MIRAFKCLALVVFGLVPFNYLHADDDSGEQQAFFETKIRPVLVEHCYRCHAKDSKNIRGGLLLDTRAGIRRGGESGPAVVPNDIDESLLIGALRHESFEMPPDRKLPDAVIEDFEKWIEMGAPDPREGSAPVLSAGIDLETGREFWCFRSLASSEVPSTKDMEWPITDVDRFILYRLEAEGLKPSPDADRRTLLRRVYIDLIGLPPTPQQIEAFCQSDSPQAFEEVVDELLRSTHFGERWSRHWLDVVRFAESSGGGRTLLFPDAWRYRDYVIDAFNEDVPYDLFVKQQLAGDLMHASDVQTKRRNLIATGFLLLGPTNYELQDKEILEMDIVDEQLDTLGKAMLGMTIGCARCHDHKFDPIPTRDYYAMAGILKSTRSVIHSNVSKWNEVELPMSPRTEAEIEQVEMQVETLNDELTKLRKELVSLGGRPSRAARSIDPASLPGIVVDDQQAKKIGNWTVSQSVAGYVGDNYLHSTEPSAGITYSPMLSARGEYEVRISYTASSNRSSKVPIRIHHANGETVVPVNQKKFGAIDGAMDSLGLFEFSPEQNPRVSISPKDAADGVVIADAVIFIPIGVKTTDAEREALQERLAKQSDLNSRIKALERKIKEQQSTGPKRDTAMAAAEEGETGNIPISIRGLVHNPGPIVPRGFLQVAAYDEQPNILDDQSGRLQLAEWIADTRNPLTARVMANRVWYWLYGRGLVRTVDNFGATGDTPTHPELLDYLAAKFMQEGWSVKQLIRHVILSRTYRQSSMNEPSGHAIDPDNRLLWRMNRRRLDAECIRDALLLVGGNLDRTTGGPNIAEGTKSEYGYEFRSTRRSVYVPVFRNQLPQIFATFDFADPNTQIGSRTSSTTAPQALLLMNHPLVIEQSRSAAAELLSREGWTDSQRIREIYLQVLGRLPNEREVGLASKFVGGNRQADRWELFYQTLFQSLDFRYLR